MARVEFTVTIEAEGDTIAEAFEAGKNDLADYEAEEKAGNIQNCKLFCEACGDEVTLIDELSENGLCSYCEDMNRGC